jgi:hypothetical protein
MNKHEPEAPGLLPIHSGGADKVAGATSRPGTPGFGVSALPPRFSRVRNSKLLAVLLAIGTAACSVWAQGHYQSFIVSTYATEGTVQRLMDGRLDPGQSWSQLTHNLKIDKIYLEVMRNHTLVDEAGLEKLKKFFQDQGVRVGGGLAFSVSEANGYQGFDYADPENRDFARRRAAPPLR